MRALRAVVVVACLGLLSTATPALAACKGAGRQLGQSNSRAVEKAIRCLVNKQRTRHGLHAFKDSAKLRGIARSYARQMSEQDFFSHTSPSGQTREDRFKAAHYAHHGAEDLGQTFSTARALVRAFMNSPIHRGILLDARWRYLGLGASVAKGRRRYALEFGPAKA